MVVLDNGVLVNYLNGKKQEEGGCFSSLISDLVSSSVLNLLALLTINMLEHKLERK
jgi:hypothetical protein